MKRNVSDKPGGHFRTELRAGEESIKGTFVLLFTKVFRHYKIAVFLIKGHPCHWLCGTMHKAMACDTSIQYQRVNSSSAYPTVDQVFLGKRWHMTQALGPLSCMRESMTELLALDLGLAQTGLLRPRGG